MRTDKKSRWADGEKKTAPQNEWQRDAVRRRNNIEYDE